MQPGTRVCSDPYIYTTQQWSIFSQWNLCEVSETFSRWFKYCCKIWRLTKYLVFFTEQMRKESDHIFLPHPACHVTLPGWIQLVSMYHQLYFLPPLSCFHAHLLAPNHIKAANNFELENVWVKWQQIILTLSESDYSFHCISVFHPLSRLWVYLDQCT